MKSLKTRTVLILSFTMIAVVLTFVSVFYIVMIQSIYTSQNNRYNVYGNGYGRLQEGYNSYKDIQILTVSNLEDGEVGKKLAAATDQMRTSFEELYDILIEEDERKLFTEVCDNIEGYLGKFEEIKQLYAAGASEAQIEQAKEDGETYVSSTEESFSKLITLMRERSDEKQAVVDKNIAGVRYFMIGITILFLLFVSWIEIYIVRRIRIPLGELTKVAVEVSNGNLDVAIRKHRNDEFGELLDDFQKMVDDMREQAHIADEVAKGNLAVEVVPRSEKDLLGNALREMVEDNNMILSGIKESSMQVTTGSNEVASASQSLAQGTTEQASAIEQITASIAEIAERTKVNATDAAAASSLVQQTKVGAERGNQQMGHMMQAMEEINESSENISKIIRVIDDIAFQTNILALNAAVEAARAGVHGKGFAVVADEVRTLAGKSATAASETAEMIEDSIRKVEHGSRLAGETAEALTQIVDSVEKIVELVNGIADASNVQAASVAQIDTAISQVSQVVQTNSATSQQCAAASEELSNQADHLRDLLGRYNLKMGIGGQAQPDYRIVNGFQEYEDHSAPMQEPSYGYQENMISLGNDYGKY